MDKLTIIINGKAETGKDTLCDFVIKNYKAEKISAITPILKIAYENGWNGEKNKTSRKFLSDLKRIFIDFNDLPNNYLIKEHEKFLKSDNNILFVHIRESDQIKAFIEKVNKDSACVTLLVRRKKDDFHEIIGNDSDDFVEDYEYDYYYDNVHSLEQAEKHFLEFFNAVLDDKKLKLKN